MIPRRSRHICITRPNQPCQKSTKKMTISKMTTNIMKMKIAEKGFSHMNTEKVSHQELAASLIKQLNMTDQVMQQCNVANGFSERKTLHGIVMAHGVGRFGARLPKGIRKLANKLCFGHATGLMLRDPRYVYCEGFAMR